MREIKFRAWDTDTSAWIIGSQVDIFTVAKGFPKSVILQQGTRGGEMNTEDLIPKFEVGENVIFKPQPIESVSCEICGKEVYCNRLWGTRLEAQIYHANFHWARCSNCGHEQHMPDGWYWVITENGEDWIAPYTLLERVNASPLSKGQER